MRHGLYAGLVPARGDVDWGDLRHEGELADLQGEPPRWASLAGGPRSRQADRGTPADCDDPDDGVQTVG